MPYRWTETAPDASGAVSYHLIAWPHRSLPRRGFVWFIGVTAALMALPLIAALGSNVLWGLLPFVMLAIGGIWAALDVSYRRGGTREELRLNASTLAIRRSDPGKPPRSWQTNSFWVRPVIRPGPVESYLTLTDGQREIELGAFLTPAERAQLFKDLQIRFATLR